MVLCGSSYRLVSVQTKKPHDLIYFLFIAAELGDTPWSYDRGIAGAKGTGNKQNHGILQSS